jgi:hypothetical protein
METNVWSIKKKKMSRIRFLYSFQFPVRNT